MSANDIGIDPLLALSDDHFALGPCHIIPYNRINTSLFGDDLLSQLYDACLLSRPSHPYGILPNAQCGMLDLSRDAICAYWSTRQLILPCLSPDWTGTLPSHYDYPVLADGHIVTGVAYLTSFLGAPVNPPNQPQPIGERAALGAYLFFRPYWGTPEIEILCMLGVAAFFHQYRLSALHGQRYSYNNLTAKMMGRLGFKDVGVIPRFLTDKKNNEVVLSDCTVSSLLRKDFEDYVTRQLISLVPDIP